MGRIRDRYVARSSAGLRDALITAVEAALLGVGARAGPGARVLSLNREVFGLWAPRASSVRRALGPEAHRVYSELVRAGTETGPELGRELALMLPDQLARMGVADLPRFRAHLEWAIAHQPRRVSILAGSLVELLPALDDRSLRAFLEQGELLTGEHEARTRGFLRRESAAALRAIGGLSRGVHLEDVSRVLALYASSHCGEAIRVQGIAEDSKNLKGRPPWRRAGAFTDGHVLHLPQFIDHSANERGFLLYRVMTAILVGYLEFGTFDLLFSDEQATSLSLPSRREGETEVERLIRAFPNRSLARELFQLIEGHRVEHRVRGEYPGIARDMDLLRDGAEAQSASPPGLAPVELAVLALEIRSWRKENSRATLEDPRIEAIVQESLVEIRSLERLEASSMDSALLLPALYQRVASLFSTGARAGLEGSGHPSGAVRPELRSAEARHLDEMVYRWLSRGGSGSDPATFMEARRELGRRPPSSWSEIDAWLDAHPGPAGGLIERGVARGPRPGTPPPSLLEGLEPLTSSERPSFIYHEWDAGLADFKPDWVRVTEYRLGAGSRDFVQQVNQRHRSAIATIRRQFEALRPQEMRLLRGLSDGDELDMDRVVEAYTVSRAGGSPSEHLYARHEKRRRDVAVAFLLDMSSSTNELVTGKGRRVIEVEKEALVLIAEALHAIGDAFAIWGFSGFGREQVAFYIARDFDEPYGELVRERIGRLSWKMENRDGAAIRHATTKLKAHPARVHLLILLSDGKPLDCGSEDYHDLQAQEDTRMALLEARKAGVHAFCITIDPEGPEYLSRIYGPHGFTVINRVEALPTRLPAIYRQLTR